MSFKLKAIVFAVILLMTMAFLLPVFSGGVVAQGSETDFVESCPVDAVSDECNPPTLQQIEFIFVRLLYAIWGLSGLIFTGLLVYNGFLYMTGNMEEAKKRISQWLIGFVLVLLSYPIVATLMRGLVGDNPCYSRLKDPGFTFFFPDVCTQVDKDDTGKP